jgi:hypothetical protein
MSGYTMTQGELLYASYAAATISSVSASAVTITASLPPIIVPGGYMAAGGSRASSLRLVVGGTITSTATVPTFAFGCAFSQTSTFAATPLLVGNSTALAGAVVTAAPFRMVLDIGLRTLSVTAASTLYSTGDVWSPGFYNTPFGVSIPATNGTFTTAAWPADLQNYLWPILTLGAATAGNTVTVNFVKLYGEN